MQNEVDNPYQAPEAEMEPGSGQPAPASRLRTLAGLALVWLVVVSQSMLPFIDAGEAVGSLVVVSAILLCSCLLLGDNAFRRSLGKPLGRHVLVAAFAALGCSLMINPGISRNILVLDARLLQAITSASLVFGWGVFGIAWLGLERLCPGQEIAWFLAATIWAGLVFSVLLVIEVCTGPGEVSDMLDIPRRDPLIYFALAVATAKIRKVTGSFLPLATFFTTLAFLVR